MTWIYAFISWQSDNKFFVSAFSLLLKSSHFSLNSVIMSCNSADVSRTQFNINTNDCVTFTISAVRQWHNIAFSSKLGEILTRLGHILKTHTWPCSWSLWSRLWPVYSPASPHCVCTVCTHKQATSAPRFMTNTRERSRGDPVRVAGFRVNMNTCPPCPSSRGEFWVSDSELWMDCGGRLPA